MIYGPGGPGVPAHSFLIDQCLVILLDGGRGSVGGWASMLSVISPLQLLPRSATSLTLVWVPGDPSEAPTLQHSKTGSAPPPVSRGCLLPGLQGRGHEHAFMLLGPWCEQSNQGAHTLRLLWQRPSPNQFAHGGWLWAQQASTDYYESPN